MRHRHFLDEAVNLKHLDFSFFSMGRKEVDDIDPQQRLLLEVFYECMQSSGEANWRGAKIGCYVGVWGEVRALIAQDGHILQPRVLKADVIYNLQDWLDIHAKDIQDSGTYRVPGGHDFALSNRISYEYDLKGPSFTVKSGCSASMIALHEAARAIQNGECSGAIVAGTNLIFSPTMSIAMTEQGVLSPDGSCKTFDAAANGYARGEAVNAVYLILQRVTGLYVPTGIEKVRSSDVQTSDGAHIHSSVETSSANVVSGSTVATSDAGVFLSLTGGRFSSLETDLSNDPDRLAAGQMDWRPHFDLADMYSLVRPSEISTVDSGELELVEKLTLLSILEINDSVSGINSTREHLQRYSK